MRRALFLGGLLFLGVRTLAAAGGDPPKEPKSVDVKRLLREIDARRIEADIRKLVSFGTRHTLSSQDDPARGIGAARDWLYQELQRISADSGGRLKVELQGFVQPRANRVPQPTKLTNVIATLEGEAPESRGRIYVVSGHYDSIPSPLSDTVKDAPGANDDASGTAAVLEMARVMASRRFDATLVFALVAGEEQGLLGSTYLAQQAKEKGWNVRGMFTNDIIGNTRGQTGLKDDRTVRLFSEGIRGTETPAELTAIRAAGSENDLEARQLARFIQETAARYVKGFRVFHVYRRDRYGRGGDHIPFLERGYPAVRFTEMHEDLRHQHQAVRVENGVQYGDLPEFVDFRYVAKVARVNAAALAELALAPDSPKGVRLRSRPSPDSELSWQASPEPDLAGYEVVWRETTSPVWTNSRKVGNVTSYTVKDLSKDNYLFGVRALDREGHRSPVAFPRPGL